MGRNRFGATALFVAVWIAVAGVVAFGSVPAVADPAADSQAVIEKQLDAFQRDDWKEAFQYASPGIQSIFRNPERFGEMVRNGYPMVWRPSSVDFIEALIQGERAIQRLRIVDANGEAYVARYFMEVIDGVWRIAGVEIEKAPASV